MEYESIDTVLLAGKSIMEIKDSPAAKEIMKIWIRINQQNDENFGTKL